MQLRKLLENIEVLETNIEEDLEITFISHKYHEMKKGAMFMALTGFGENGNFYIQKAIQRGASVVVTSKKPREDVPYVLVKDDRLAWSLINKNYFQNPASSMKMIGITGTNGKTSSTILLKHILEQTTGEKVGLMGTIENLIGDISYPAERTTPWGYDLYSLLSRMRDEGCKYVVMEVTSHSLTQHRVTGIEYDVASFTNLTEDHLDYHRTMEQYCDAKVRLFGQCKCAVGNLDSEWFEKIAARASCNFMTFSADKKADLYAKDIELFDSKTCFTVIYGENSYKVRVPVPGIFTVYNALNALSISIQLGLSLEKAVSALSSFRGVKGRMEEVSIPNIKYKIFLDYAHTPDGLEKVLLSAKEFSKGRVIVAFGCGGNRDPYKRPIMGRIATDIADIVIITSDNPRFESPKSVISQILRGIPKNKTNYKVIIDRIEAIHCALDIAEENDVVILAGKGHETSQEIFGKILHMDEREIVKEYLDRGK